MPYDAVSVCAGLGLHIRYLVLRSTWGAWVPQYRTIIIALGLTPIQQHCALAHQVEHALAGHGPCGTGPHADLLRQAGLLNQLDAEREAVADKAAARKLLAGVDVRSVARDDLLAAAHRLGVTEHLLTLRLADLRKEGGCPGTSKIAG